METQIRGKKPALGGHRELPEAVTFKMASKGDRK